MVEMKVSNETNPGRLAFNCLFYLLFCFFDCTKIFCILGGFGMSYPYANYVCVVDERNPVRYLNDARGIDGACVNTVFEVADSILPLMLDPEQGLQKMIYNKSTVAIRAGEQLFCDYGKKYWDKHPELRVSAVIDVLPGSECYTSAVFKDFEDDLVGKKKRDVAGCPEQQHKSPTERLDI